MLTKQDLKEIKKVVNEAIVPVKIDTAGLKVNFSGLKSSVSSLEKSMLGLKKDIKKVDKKVDLVIKAFDREYLDLQKRVQRVETHLQLKPIADF